MTSSSSAPKVGFVSLGCPKNLTDSELIITQLSAEGYQTARSFAGADLVIVNGLGFEGWMTRLIGSAGYRGPVLTCSDGLKPRAAPVEAGQDHAGHAHGHSHGQGSAQSGGGAPDPHAWQDIANARHYVARIRDALVTARPAQAELLRQPCVKEVFEEHGNFLLARFASGSRLFQAMVDQGIILRDFGNKPMLEDCVRVTIGDEAEMAEVVAVLKSL